MGEQVSVTEVANGLRDLAAILESGELGEELTAQFVQSLTTEGIRALAIRRDEFVEWSRRLEGAPSDRATKSFLAVESMCGPIPLIVSGYARSVGDAATRTETVETWELPAELREVAR